MNYSELNIFSNDDGGDDEGLQNDFYMIIIAIVSVGMIILLGICVLICY